MTRPPYWTAADQAELAVRAREMVDAVSDCICGGGAGCDPCREAIEQLVAWRDGQVLRARAEWLRRQRAEDELEHALDVVYGAGLIRTTEWLDLTRPLVLQRRVAA